MNKNTNAAGEFTVANLWKVIMPRAVKAAAFTFFAAAVYIMSCLLCIINSSYLSPEDYSRMSQEIVEQSLNMEANP